MRVGQLVKEAGLADAGLAHDGDDLAVAAPRLLQRRAELAHFDVAPDEAAQAPARGRLKPRPRLPGRDEVVDLNGSVEALDGNGAEGLDLHEALGQARVSAVMRTVPGRASCSMRAATCVVWPTAV